MAANLGTKIAISGFVRTIATRQLVMEWGLSGRLTDYRYCGYLAPMGCCHDNHFLAFSIWGAYWCHLALANTTKLPMCGGDVALCQITLASCLALSVLLLQVYDS